LKLKITVDGKQYDVDVEIAEEDRPQSGPYYYVPPAAAVHVPSPAPVAAPPARKTETPVADESKVCRSQIAGVVVRINVQVGQQIQANDPLLVLEAMKMETNITSPVSGKIKALNADLGEGVQIGQVLVEFE
jgi:methylmalonyl-CoA carboxyltransferase small subunit